MSRADASAQLLDTWRLFNGSSSTGASIIGDHAATSSCNSGGRFSSRLDGRNLGGATDTSSPEADGIPRREGVHAEGR